MASKGKLCAIPCSGDFLFGPFLGDLLEKALDGTKRFTSLDRDNSFRSCKFIKNQDRRPSESKKNQVS